MAAIVKLLSTALLLIIAAEGRETLKPKITHRPAEIVVVLDASRNVQDDDFHQMIAAIRAVPDFIRMGENQTRIAVVTVGRRSKMQVPLTWAESRIRSLPYDRWNGVGGGNRTSEGMWRRAMDALGHETRMGATKIVIWITDGLSADHDHHYGSIDQADVVIYAAYIGEMTPEIHGQLIYATGDQRRVFNTVDATRVAEVLHEILEVIEFDLLECECDQWADIFDWKVFGSGIAVGMLIMLVIIAVVIGGLWMKKRRTTPNAQSDEGRPIEGIRLYTVTGN